LDDLVLQKANLPENPRVLDAGCGFGGTIFRWYPQREGKYHGFTLSKYQQKIATKEAQRRGISQQCHFYIQSFSDPVNEKYHAVVAIESLIHSQDLPAVIKNLSQGLLPGGKLLIVDDMALDSSAHKTREYACLQNYWLISDLASVKYYSTLLAQNGLKITSNLDLTPQLNFPTNQALEKRIKFLSFLIRIIPIGSLRTFLKTHLGGFALQKLYLNGKLKYQLIVAEKKR
jgi:cyclopropane fatty-acyl-phospholipid synthase-like methyltransferase